MDYAALLHSLSTDTSNGNDILVALQNTAPEDDDQRLHLVSTGFLPFLSQTIQTTIPRLPQSEQYKSIAARAACLVAEVAKAEPARSLIADAGLIPVIISLNNAVNSRLLTSPNTVSSGDEQILIHSCRALANSCLDHDDNRELCLEHGAIPALLSCLKSQNPYLLRIVCGTLLNVSVDNEPVQNEIVKKGGYGLLFQLVKNAGFHEQQRGLAAAACRVISNLVEIDSGIAGLIDTTLLPVSQLSPTGSGISFLLHLLRRQHQFIQDPDCEEDDYDNALEIIECIVVVLESCSESDLVQRQLVAQDCLLILLDFVDHRPPRHLLQRGDRDDEDEGDSKPVNYNELRKTISKIVTLVTMNDTNMRELTLHQPAVIQRFKTWLSYGFTIHTESPIEEDEIRMNGALSIGNLARSDETSTKLLHDYDTGAALLELLRMEVNRFMGNFQVKEEFKSLVKVLHAVVGTFKNLSLTAGNKARLGELGVIPVISKVLEFEGIKPVQYGVVVVLKNLCALGHVENAYRIIMNTDPPSNVSIPDIPLNASDYETTQTSTPLHLVMKMLSRATGDNDLGVRSEGSRVIVNLIKTCYQMRAANLLRLLLTVNPINPLMQLITGKVIRNKPREASLQTNALHGSANHHVHFETISAEGQVFPVLQSDAIVAAILLVQVFPELVGEVTKYATILTEPLLQILASGVVVSDSEKSVVKASKSSKRKVSMAGGDNGSEEDEEPNDSQLIPKSLQQSGKSGSLGTLLSHPRSQEYSEEMKLNAAVFLEVLCKGDEHYKSTVIPNLAPILQARTSAAAAEEMESIVSPIPVDSAMDFLDGGNVNVSQQSQSQGHSQSRSVALESVLVRLAGL